MAYSFLFGVLFCTYVMSVIRYHSKWFMSSKFPFAKSRNLPQAAIDRQTGSYAMTGTKCTSSAGTKVKKYKFSASSEFEPERVSSLPFIACSHFVNLILPNLCNGDRTFRWVRIRAFGIIKLKGTVWRHSFECTPLSGTYYRKKQTWR